MTWFLIRHHISLPLHMSDPFTIPTAARHQIMVTVNEMDEWIVRTRTMRLGRHVSPPLPILDPCTTQPLCAIDL